MVGQTFLRTTVLGTPGLRASVAAPARSSQSGPGLPLRQGPRPRGLLRRRLLLGGAAIALCAPAWAGPEGERVMAGNVNFARQLGLTQITASNRAIINWNSFNVGTNETVQFFQPSATSRVRSRKLPRPNPVALPGPAGRNNWFCVNMSTMFEIVL